MRTSPLRSGDLWLDVVGRRARRGTTELSLSMREQALLEELFLRHPGEIISRTHIRERVWNSAFDVESNVVDQYVSHLRRKIDRPFGRRDIETVRGAGYRLRPTRGARAGPPAVPDCRGPIGLRRSRRTGAPPGLA